MVLLDPLSFLVLVHAVVVTRQAHFGKTPVLQIPIAAVLAALLVVAWMKVGIQVLAWM